MIVADIGQRRRIARSRSRSHLWYTPFRPAELLNRVRARDFPTLSGTIEIRAVDADSLACISHDPDQPEAETSIHIHQLLNHPDTPAEVFEFIFQHELLHLLIPPREVDGTLRNHPPEFWAAEQTLCPNRATAWAWVWINLEDSLRRRPKLERVDVLRGWKKNWSLPRSSLNDVRDLLQRGAQVPAAAGW